VHLHVVASGHAIRNGGSHLHDQHLLLLLPAIVVHNTRHASATREVRRASNHEEDAQLAAIAKCISEKTADLFSLAGIPESEPCSRDQHRGHAHTRKFDRPDLAPCMDK
jgi:hypothetical protein